MNKKEPVIYLFVGFCLGVLLTVLIWIAVSLHYSTRSADSGAVAGNPAETGTSAPSVAEDTAATKVGGDTAADAFPAESSAGENAADNPSPDTPSQATEADKNTAEKNDAEEPSATTEGDKKMTEKDSTENPSAIAERDKNTDPAAETDAPDSSAGASESASQADSWDSTAVYTGGNTVSYQGKLYTAKWWTQGEAPGTSDVWENLGIVDGNATQPEGITNTPVNAAIPQDTALTDFKVVGYYPSWKPDSLQSVDFGVLTHVCYAFAIPTAEGGLMDLENAATAEALIRSAHENGAKVLLSIGGWSYNDTPLENTFMEATSDDAKIEKLAGAIIAMCEKYGFDGIDMDWEHPRVDGTSARQYEALMLTLSEQLHAKDKLLTAAVLSGATADGNIYYDAAAHTNAVLNAVDFINIMAYDGGDGERHSAYDFAVNAGTYWKETRGLPSHKVVLGVPFYARPSWAGYGTILETVPDAYSQDHVSYNGMDVYYNGIDTIAKKTAYAMENLGGIMIWELTQDTSDKSKSLLQTIGDTAKKQ